MAFVLISLFLIAAPSLYAQEAVYSPSKYLQVPQIALSFEIPREEEPAPFNTYIIPSSELRAPDEIPAPEGNFFEVPVPSQDLEVPHAAAWNPDNDPTLLYELPAAVTKAIVPTNQHPKKYEKAVFEKNKPASLRPKEEIVLLPIKVQDYVSKQKQQDKTLYNFAKNENQKVIKDGDQVNATQSRPVLDSSSSSSSSSTNQFHLDRPLSSQSGDRVEFQMHGHDGPKSYKWGFDTGKGHNRQFRYEESDNDGYVKGHYGYYDKHGKLKMVHYDSHPEDGFHAESGDQ